MTGSGHKTDPLFTGLTRAPMLHGVPLEFFGLNFIAFGIGMILCDALLGKIGFLIFVSLPLHGAGMLLSRKEPHWMRIILIKISKCPPIKNSRYWKCKSYQP